MKQNRYQPSLEGEHHGNMHRRWENIVGGLPHIHVVIGMDAFASGVLRLGVFLTGMRY